MFFLNRGYDNWKNVLCPRQPLLQNKFFHENHVAYQTKQLDVWNITV